MKTYVIDSAMQRSVSNRLRYKEARQTKSADLVEGMKKRQKRGGEVTGETGLYGTTHCNNVTGINHWQDKGFDSNNGSTIIKGPSV